MLCILYSDFSDLVFEKEAVVAYLKKHATDIPSKQFKHDRQCGYKRNIGTLSSKQFCHWKALGITYSACAPVASVIVCKVRYPYLSSVACSSLA
jgi:hypothetical protein